MNANGKHFEVRSPEGTLMFSVHLVDESTTNGNRTNGASNNGSGTGASARAESNGQKNAVAMTDSQRKYLFQILSDRGFNSDQAHEHLKRLFGVDSLTTVGKQQASLMIKRLLQDAEAK
jgi:hypothetical protein